MMKNRKWVKQASDVREKSMDGKAKDNTKEVFKVC